MLPPAPTRFSTITGCPSALDKGSARVRAIRSGDDPPGKPTTMRSVLLGQLAGLWARAGRVRPLKVRPRAWRREMEVGMAAAPRIANQYKGQQCAHGGASPTSEKTRQQKAGRIRLLVGEAAEARQANSASAFFIFFIAATSIWRMRSAL